METIRLKVYRYNPDTDAKPYMQDYELEIEPAAKASAARTA